MEHKEYRVLVEIAANQRLLLALSDDDNLTKAIQANKNKLDKYVAAQKDEQFSSFDKESNDLYRTVLADVVK